MNAGNIRTSSALLFTLLTLCACASNIAVYEPPTLGRLSEITFTNAAKSQEASLMTFVDGLTCTGRRRIQVEGEDAISAGSSHTFSAAADREFALFVRLASIEDEEYGVELGATGSGPAPVIRRTVTAIGCNANLSFEVESENIYHVEISEPTSSGSCSVAVSRIGMEGEVVAVESTRRISRAPRNDSGPFCESLVK